MAISGSKRPNGSWAMPPFLPSVTNPTVPVIGSKVLSGRPSRSAEMFLAVSFACRAAKEVLRGKFQRDRELARPAQQPDH